MNRIRLALATALFVLAFTFAPSAHAVDVTGRIKGTVSDPQGAVIPNVEVVATNVATGVKYTTKTQSDGGYLLPQLPIGTYNVSATVPGFTSFKATGITLNIDQEYVEAIHMTVGSENTAIEVVADAVQVNTTDMELSNIVTSAQMVELPLIGRNFTGLALTLPGVQAGSDRFGGSSINGSQSTQASFLINGADDNDIALNTLVVAPNLDAIDQFNLIDGPLNAEYDRNSGGIISATIKQGGNQFHGNVFEFYRDTFLNTNNFFQKSFNSSGVRTDKVSPFHQHIFGGTLGGPVLKDRLFFFGAYQGTRQRVPGATTTNTVYSAAELTGDLSQFNGASITRPLTPDGVLPTSATTYGSFSNKSIPSSVVIPGCTTPLETYAQCAFDLKGKFPTSAFNPISQKLITQYVPAPNSGATGFNYNATNTTVGDQYIGRVDYNFNPSNRFTAVGLYNKSTASNGLPFSGASLPGFGDGSLTHSQVWTGDYVHTFSATAVNDIAAHYTRLDFNSGAPQHVVAPSSVGFVINPQDTGGQTIPTIAVNGGYFTLGGTNNGPQPRIDQTIQFDDSFSMTFGHHTLKMGYDGRRFNVSNKFDASNSGSYAFSSAGTFSSGDASVDFLLGVPASFGQGSGNVIQADAFLNYLYAQDTWKLTNTFTFDYGMGYSIDTPLRNHQYGGLAVACGILSQQSVIFPGAPKGLNYPGDPGCTNSGQAYTRYSEFGPRIGFAWAPDLGVISGSPGKFSVRGGFGIYYDRSEEETALQTLGTPPFGINSTGAGDFTGKPQFANPYLDINGGRKQSLNGVAGAPLSAASEANRFPYAAPVAGAPVSFAQYGQIANISSFSPGFRAPYAENFQLSVEREMPSRIIARLSYVGSLSRHNQNTFEGIPITQAGHDACLKDPACVADQDDQAYDYAGTHTAATSQNFVEIGEVGSSATSSYHSFQASINKVQSHGLSFQLSYTYAHAQDAASNFENSGFGSSGARGYNQYDTSRNWGDSLFDARQRLVFSPTYISPSLKGNWYSPLNLALSGWEVSAISTAATGLPFDISYGGFGTSKSLYCAIDSSFYACPDAPNQIAPLVRANPRVRIAANGNRGQYFQKASFAPETTGFFGNVHRNPYHGPGINNTNLILAKNFNLSSDGFRRIQLRMESDNAFNHTQFANPNGTFSDAVPASTTTSFGQISAAAAARVTQLGAKIYF